MWWSSSGAQRLGDRAPQGETLLELHCIDLPGGHQDQLVLEPDPPEPTGMDRLDEWRDPVLHVCELTPDQQLGVEVHEARASLEQRREVAQLVPARPRAADELRGPGAGTPDHLLVCAKGQIGRAPV